MNIKSFLSYLVAGLLIICPSVNFAQLPTNNDPGNQIRFASVKAANERRIELITFFWSKGLPLERLPEVTPDVTAEELGHRFKYVNQKWIKNIDEWELEVFGIRSVMYHILPVKPLEIPRLAILHAGHAPMEEAHLKKNYRSAIEFFLERGYEVVMIHMPMHGWNDDCTVVFPEGGNEVINLHDKDKKHDEIVKLVDGVQGIDPGAGFRPFLEPVVASINYWDQRSGVDPDITMIGLSGGGWTTHLLAAMDTRIKLSFPIAGSFPLYLRNGEENRSHLGDLEQYYSALYDEDIASDGTGGGKATWMEIYALGGTGKGRKQIMITSRYDACCFFGDPETTVNTFKFIVKDKVEELGAGAWEHRLDTTHHEHIISPWMLENVVNPALKK